MRVVCRKERTTTCSCPADRREIRQEINRGRPLTDNVARSPQRGLPSLIHSCFYYVNLRKDISLTFSSRGFIDMITEDNSILRFLGPQLELPHFSLELHSDALLEPSHTFTMMPRGSPLAAEEQKTTPLLSLYHQYDAKL